MAVVLPLQNSGAQTMKLKQANLDARGFQDGYELRKAI
jgi:hypothetical protein